MKILLISLAAVMTLLAQEKTAQKPAPAKANAAVTIPAGAVETQPGTFAYTDANGKKWIYRKTPFGIARLEDKAADAKPVISAHESPGKGFVVKATEDGDVVHFERPSPFGPYKWNRAKSELNDEERGWLEQARTAKAKQD
jgi:hypothetical protein